MKLKSRVVSESSERLRRVAFSTAHMWQDSGHMHTFVCGVKETQENIRRPHQCSTGADHKPQRPQRKPFGIVHMQGAQQSCQSCWLCNLPTVRARTERRRGTGCVGEVVGRIGRVDGWLHATLLPSASPHCREMLPTMHQKAHPVCCLNQNKWPATAQQQPSKGPLDSNMWV